MTHAAFAAIAVLTGFCLALAVSDLRSYVLPDRLTFGLGVCGLGFAVILDPSGLPDRLIGAVAGFAVFEAVALLYRRFRGREGLGQGDSKLMAAAGTWVGWHGLPSVVLVGSLIALAGTLLTEKLYSRDISATTRIPLGAYLSIGLWTTWILGPISI